MKILNLTNIYSYKPLMNISHKNYSFNSFHGNSSQKVDEKSFENFNKWALQNDFVNKVKNITRDSKNIIGSGFEGKVYSIPDSDNWVIKEYFRSNLVPRMGTEEEIEKLDDISPELNIGQAIAKINIPINDRYIETIFIHKKQTGKSIGVDAMVINKVSDSTSQTHLETLAAIANLPQSSFDKLIDDVKTISRLGYKIDGTTPNNILLDKTNNRLNFVDIADKDSDKTPQYSEVLYSLLGASFSDRFLDSDRPNSEKTQAKQYSETIIKKFTSSMNAKKVSFGPTYNLYRLVNSTVFLEYSNKFNNK